MSVRPSADVETLNLLLEEGEDSSESGIIRAEAAEAAQGVASNEVGKRQEEKRRSFFVVLSQSLRHYLGGSSATQKPATPLRFPGSAKEVL